MRAFSAIDLHFLMRELKELEQTRVDNFYYDDGTFTIKSYKTGVGNLFLTVKKELNVLYISKEKEESSDFPTSFIQYLRKYLKNAFIRDVSQIHLERIVKLVFEKKIDEELIQYFMYIELFAKGNIILTDSKETIIQVLNRKTFKDRTVRVKQTYELPPAKEYSLSSLDPNNLSSDINSFDGTITQFMATRLGLGSVYSKELAQRAKLQSNELSIDDAQLLSNKAQEFMDLPLEPGISMKDEKVNNFLPFKFESLEEENVKKETFNECVKLAFEKEQTTQDAKEKSYENELKKLEKRYKQQLAQKEHLEKEIEEMNDIGTQLYEHYTELEEFLKNPKENSQLENFTISKVDTQKREVTLEKKN